MGLFLRELKRVALGGVKFGSQYINDLMNQEIGECPFHGFATITVRFPSNRFIRVKLLSDKGVPKLGDFKSDFEIGNMLDGSPQVNIVNVDPTRDVGNIVQECKP